MNQLTKQDIDNIIALIGAAPIKGSEAITVAQLQMKLSSMSADLRDPINSPVEVEGENNEPDQPAE